MHQPQGSGGGVAVWALASHHCDPGSILRLGVISELSLLFVEFEFVVWVCWFFSGFSGFPPSVKINISKSQLEEEPLCGTTVNSYLLLFIYLFIIGEKQKQLPVQLDTEEHTNGFEQNMHS
jgi:hypothetical protein